MWIEGGETCAINLDMEVKQNEIVSDLIHMSVNRLFKSKQNLIESILLDNLLSIYNIESHKNNPHEKV